MKTLRYVIGDIHGNIIALKKLISHLRNPRQLIFLGDYIDKGIYVKECIEFLIKLQLETECIFLIGNHEYALREYYTTHNKKWLTFLEKYGGKQTVYSYINVENVSDKTLMYAIETMKKLKHWNFINKLQIYYETEEYFIFHSGYDISFEFVSDIIENNMESILFSRNQFINSTKLLEGKKLIFGHTAFKTPYIDNYKIGIDTGAGYGEELTAFNIDEKYFINSLGDITYLNH